jgi:hypothetical protein
MGRLGRRPTWINKGPPMAGRRRWFAIDAPNHEGRFPAHESRAQVLTFASSTNPANRKTTLGNHAATSGLITPPAPTALVI